MAVEESKPAVDADEASDGSGGLRGAPDRRPGPILLGEPAPAKTCVPVPATAEGPAPGAAVRREETSVV
jgi:hypothetical protein